MIKTKIMLNNSKLQAFLAIAPMVLFGLMIIGYFVFFFTMITQVENFDDNAINHNEPAFAFFAGFGIFFVLIMLTVLLSLCSLIYFILHAAKNPNLEANNGNMRLVWILIMVFVSGIGQLIYWIAEIKTKKPRPVIPN